jgi:uncharacterized protein YdeI (YjbR/CyaY-like superfamily)
VTSTREMQSDIPVKAFKSQKEWTVWLDKNHAKSSGIWLKVAKKDAASKSVTYAEALEVALCYGWIDGQKKGWDESAWLQKFSPRGPRSIWSKINRAKAKALIENGQMKPAGLAAIEQAKKNGQWDGAYDSQRTVAVPADFQAQLDKHPEAQAFFQTLDSANRYAILFRLQTAKKAETHARRIEQFIRMLENHEKIHP